METKERTEGRLRRLLEQPGTFLKWVLFAGVIGLAAGGVSSAFYYALNAVTALREANPWLLWLLPLGGVAMFCSTGFAAWRRTGAPTSSWWLCGRTSPCACARRPSSSPPRCSPTCWAAPPAGRGHPSRSAAPSPPRSDGGCTWTTRTAVSSPCAACPPPSPPSSALR